MPIGKNPDLRTDALKAAYDGIIQAKPRLDVRDPEQLKAWGALDGAEKATFRFHHVSTDEVYGSLAPDAPAFTEAHPYEPNSPYSASKAASDHLVRAWHHTYGLPVLTTNCSNNYGPFTFPRS